MSAPSAQDPAGPARLDRWLFAVRLFRSRALAARAVAGGRVHLNGERARPSREVRPGDRLTLTRDTIEFECTVREVPPRRGPAPEAARCYEEASASRARRAAFAARMKVAAALTPRPPARPGKHERALLRRLRGRI